MSYRPAPKYYENGELSRHQYTGDEVELFHLSAFNPLVREAVPLLAEKMDISHSVQSVRYKIQKHIIENLKAAPMDSADKKRYCLLHYLGHEVKNWGMTKERILEASDEAINDIWKHQNCHKLVLRSAEREQYVNQRPPLYG